MHTKFCRQELLPEERNFFHIKICWYIASLRKFLPKETPFTRSCGWRTINAAGDDSARRHAARFAPSTAGGVAHASRQPSSEARLLQVRLPESPGAACFVHRWLPGSACSRDDEHRATTCQPREKQREDRSKTKSMLLAGGPDGPLPKAHEPLKFSARAQRGKPCGACSATTPCAKAVAIAAGSRATPRCCPGCVTVEGVKPRKQAPVAAKAVAEEAARRSRSKKACTIS